jgi:putative permease
MAHYIFWVVIFICITIIGYASRLIVAPFFIGFTLAYIFQPMICYLHNKFNLPKSVVGSAVVLIFLMVVLGICITGIPLLYKELYLFVLRVPQYTEYLMKNIIPSILPEGSNIASRVKDHADIALKEFASNLLHSISSVWGYTMATFSLIFNITLIPLIFFYFTKDWDNMLKNLKALLPLKHKKSILKSIQRINMLLGAYIRGQLIICFWFFLYYTIGLTIIGVDFSLLIGILSSVLIIIPFIGSAISFIIVNTVTLYSGDLYSLIYINALYLSGQLIEGWFITPKIIGQKIGIHPLWIIFSMFFFGSILGVWGLLIAIPCIVVLKVLTLISIENYKFSKFYNYEMQKR